MSIPFKIYHFEDLSVGMRETLMKAVMDDDVIAFADLSGDRNPIHLSEHFASKTRFGERIVHGLYTASLISTVIGMPIRILVSRIASAPGTVPIAASGRKPCW